MVRARGMWVVVGIAALMFGLGLAWVPSFGGTSPEPSDDRSDVGPVADPLPIPDRVDWVGIGGGAEPALNQVSLEEDLLLVREIFGSDGVVLFAGGPGTRS